MAGNIIEECFESKVNVYIFSAEIQPYHCYFILFILLNAYREKEICSCGLPFAFLYVFIPFKVTQ